MLRAILRPMFGVDIDNTPLIALLAAGALWLARAPPESGTTLLALLLWGTALLALVSGFARASRHYRFEALPRPRPDALQRVCFWGGAAALLTAAASLFAAEHWSLAVVVTIHLFGRLFYAVTAWERGVDPATMTRESIVRYEFAAIACGILMLVATLWIAFGSPPAWVANLLIVIWWLLLITALLTTTLALHVSLQNPLPRRLAERIFHMGDASTEVLSDPGILGNRALITYSLTVPPVLAMAGLTLPACLAFLCLLLFGAEYAQRELIEAADKGRPARLGWVAWANHLIVTNWLLLVFSPVRHVSNLLGIGAARDAAELRAAFGRPQGFVYFLWSEPLQRVPYLERGGLLEDYADYVIERNWRRDVMEGGQGPARSAAAQAAEQRLLARHEVLRKGTPFLIVVPPTGSPRAFRLTTTGMPRWGNGDPLSQSVEFSVLSALTKAFGPGAASPL